MPDYQFNTNLGPQAQQPTSLADLVNMARGVQAYQQAEQLNPLAVQKAQMDIQQAQKLNPLAVTKAEEEVKQAKTGTQEKAFDLATKKAQKSREIMGALATSEAFRSGNRQQMLKQISDTQQELVRAGYEPHEALLAISPIVDKTMRDPSSVVPFLENTVRQSVGGQSQLSLQTPQLTTNAANALVGANPVTNKVNVIGEGNQIGGDQNVGGQNVNQNFNFGANPSGITVGATKEQATQAINDYLGSLNSMTDTTKVGHIPTQEMVAKKLLTYLKDPQVDTGPIADVLAGKTNQATLTAKEQEVLKLIQQRIQNLNPRTDADAQSKKDAYGSFRLKKDALMDLIRQDLGGIQNQKLLANGLINAAGSPNNPNLPAVTAFKQKYSDFSKDQALMQYIGIVGTGQKASIDEEDKNALRKLIKTFNLSNLSDLEEKRKQLVEITGAK